MDLFSSIPWKKVFLILPVVLIFICIVYTVFTHIRLSKLDDKMLAEYLDLQKQIENDKDKGDKDDSLYSARANGESLVQFVNTYLSKRNSYLSKKNNSELDEVDVKELTKDMVEVEMRYQSFVADSEDTLSLWVLPGNNDVTWEFVTMGLTNTKESNCIFLGQSDQLRAVMSCVYDGDTNLFKNLKVRYTNNVVGGNKFVNTSVGLLVRNIIGDNVGLYETQGHKSFDRLLFPENIHKSDNDTMTDGLVVFYEDGDTDVIK